MLPIARGARAMTFVLAASGAALTAAQPVPLEVCEVSPFEVDGLTSCKVSSSKLSICDAIAAPPIVPHSAKNVALHQPI